MLLLLDEQLRAILEFPCHYVGFLRGASDELAGINLGPPLVEILSYNQYVVRDYREHTPLPVA